MLRPRNLKAVSHTFHRGVIYGPLQSAKVGAGVEHPHQVLSDSIPCKCPESENLSDDEHGPESTAWET